MLKIRYFENIKNFYLLIHFDNYLKESVNGLREGKFPDDNKELKVNQHEDSKRIVQIKTNFFYFSIKVLYILYIRNGWNCKY